MSTKTEVRPSADYGDVWFVDGASYPVLFTDESDAHKFAAMDLLIDELEKIRGKCASPNCVICAGIDTALAAARVPEG